ncbi:MAG: molybdopterin converting factor subunit 1 [Burkholderiales bacterium]|nr:MAG: molybdopterin converting factor subunit 1 [Burkholderiales bacterium]
MKIEVLYFASLREAVGRGREQLELPPDVVTAAALRAHLRARGGAWTDALAEGRTLRVAVDQAMAADDAPLRDGAEVAFFPPVTGG